MENFTSFSDEAFARWEAKRQELLFIAPERQWIWALGKCGMDRWATIGVQQLSNELGITETLEYTPRR